MPRYVAFLRAVNVGGARTVKMEVLRQTFREAGFSNVASFIASGNIIFETPARNTALVEERIERALLQEIGYELTPFVRTGPELEQIIAFDAFPTSRRDVRDQLAVIFFICSAWRQGQKAPGGFPLGDR